MRAVTVTGKTSDQRLAIERVACPAPMPGEALVAVRAISLNNGEVRTALAGPEGARPGWDFSGIVETAPAGSVFSVGDRVVGLQFEGAWAERVTVPTAFLAPIPDNVSFELAAVLPVAGLTARIALSKKALRPGDKVLITAARGGAAAIARADPINAS